MYTIPLDFLYELIEESEEQVSVTKSLLHDFLNGIPDNKNLMSIVVEILWANNSILKLVNDEIETVRINDMPSAAFKYIEAYETFNHINETNIKTNTPLL